MWMPAKRLTIGSFQVLFPNHSMNVGLLSIERYFRKMVYSKQKQHTSFSHCCFYDNKKNILFGLIYLFQQQYMYILQINTKTNS